MTQAKRSVEYPAKNVIAKCMTYENLTFQSYNYLLKSTDVSPAAGPKIVIRRAILNKDFTTENYRVMVYSHFGEPDADWGDWFEQFQEQLRVNPIKLQEDIKSYVRARFMEEFGFELPNEFTDMFVYNF